MMVTREHNRVGWKLRDYAQEIGINSDLLIFERGMDHKQLWTTYAVSDVFLLPSKAEGLGLPLLEAMAVGLPCIATNFAGMAELLENERGFLVHHEYTHRDPFGNGSRYWISSEGGTGWLNEIYYSFYPNKLEWGDGQIDRINSMKENARKYVESRTWDIAVDQVEKSLLELVGDENGS
jgi:glycosyltransferase involved in cell wall biosynthesis